jgi:hypothetical protein
VTREQARATIVRCDGCGAAVEYDATVQAPRCAFCGSVTHLETIEDPLEQAEAIVPFSVTPRQAQQALKAWLGKRGFFAPSTLASEAALESMKPLWWPAWIFEAEAEVSWTADSDAGAGRSRWAPHAGRTPMTFRQILVPASRGLTMRECEQLTPRFDLAAQSQGEPPPGARMERFDTQRSGARRRVAAAIESTALAAIQRDHVPGSRFRNAHVAVLLRGLVTRRYALPTYVLAYRYGGEVYRALVHGQDPAVVLGSSPVSGWKVAAVVAVITAAVILILWLVLRQ